MKVEVVELVVPTFNQHNPVDVRIVFLLNLHFYLFTIIVLLRQASCFFTWFAWLNCMTIHVHVYNVLQHT